MQGRKLIGLVITVCILIQSFSVMAFAEPKVLSTRYHLDTGIWFTWRDGQKAYDKGAPGETVKNTTEFEFKAPKDAGHFKVIDVFPYTPGNTRYIYPDDKGWESYPDSMQFYSINTTKKNRTEKEYVKNYHQFGMSNLSLLSAPQYNNKTGKLSFQWQGTLTSNRRADKMIRDGGLIVPDDMNYGDYDFTNSLNLHGITEINALMGTIPDNMLAQMEKYNNSQKKGENVQAFVYFIPMVIVYQEIDDRDLVPLRVILDCDNTPMYLGEDLPLRGFVDNRNSEQVITHYILTANGTKLKDVWGLHGAHKSMQVKGTYSVPSDMKLGTIVTFKLEAYQYLIQEPPAQYIYDASINANVPNPAFIEFSSIHKQRSDLGGVWYNPSEYVSGESICKKSAILPEEDPIENGLTPSIIVD